MANKLEGNITKKAVGGMLGAACGDALGWPNERVGQSTSDKDKSKGALAKFRKWTRRSGGRYYPHEETIDAGTYSDDTQLILCIARSLRHGTQWWDRFCRVELPFWTLYERGGGGATKRSADAWTDGVPPWSEERKKNDVKKYFEAGGNGVAMRILPHTLSMADRDVFGPVAQNILLDGIATHGHPRALVGALCYGYALWKSLRRTERLQFGEVIDDLLDNYKDWSSFPESNAALVEWLHTADKQVLDYQGLWNAAVDELIEYLNVCSAGISKGALTIDDDVLRALRCYDRKVSGAGTVAVAASVYLASRYAHEPLNGVTQAAYAIGADTDTIASMAGGLLGTISEIEWLSPLKERVQDSEYLQVMAKTLIGKSAITGITDAPRQVTRSQLKKFKDHLLEINPNKSLALPDGRCGQMVSTDETIGKSGKFKVVFCKIAIEDGQSIEISKIEKGAFSSDQASDGTNRILPTVGTLNFGIKLPTRELNKAVCFYNEILGLEIKRKAKDVVTFKQGLVLVPENYLKSQHGASDTHAIVYIEVADIAGLFSRVKNSGINIVTPLSQWRNSKWMYFICNDLDGNIIEVLSKGEGVGKT